jgi:hypothetical protein
LGLGMGVETFQGRRRYKADQEEEEEEWMDE